ncbi:MAG: hypothetical protein KAV87_22455, partial [Desulfobacteraceae bacterium]|nr:hypothetical protein [Desulfobacteraceae bacterium]
MANAKIVALNWSNTGLTVYLIIERDVDGYLLNDADGDFAAAPADPYVAMTEDATIKGRYEKSESRVAWDDGRYLAYIYRQAGASPSPVADTLIGSGEIYIETDAEVSDSLGVSTLLARLTSERASNLDGLGHATDIPGNLTFGAAPGALPSGTYTYRVAAINSWGESVANAQASFYTELLETPVAVYDSEQTGT